MTDTPEIEHALTPRERLLTPFPRRNHLTRLRRARERRHTRMSLGGALALGVVLTGTSVAANAAEPTTSETTRVAETVEELGATATAESVLADAESALDGADASVDTSTLSSYVATLSDYPTLSSSVVMSLAEQTSTEADSVEADTAAAQKAAEEAAAEAAAQKAAEEAAAEEAAQEQAAANTVEGAKATAESMASSEYGWGSDQFSCLVSLWNKESGWNYQASNSSSGAYGIPQALPGSKMASAGTDWATNATTQIAWGLSYISGSYGTPCSAWAHSQSYGWY